MTSRSQRHLAELRGADSSGDSQGIISAKADLTTAGGTNSVPATFALNGNFNRHTKLSIHIVTSSQPAGVDFTYTPTQAMAPDAVATAFAVVIDANAKIVATASGKVVSCLAAGGDTVITLSALTITAV
jgi:hypothetical protein